jgi:4-amino-4-deoxy-L-arabinose transferase-like glycosyltransferase
MLMLCATLATHSLIGDNLTYDEVIHLTGGLSILETGDFRLALGTPPLAQVWAALPVWLSGVDWPPADLPAWRDSDVFGVGRAWFYDLNDGESLLVGARLMIVALLLATCAMTYRVAHDLFGVVAARVSLALAALSPTLLAHGRLVTTDLPAALAFLLSVWTFAGAIAPSERVRVGRLLAAAASFTALCLTKFSWPLLLPALLMMATVALCRQRAHRIRTAGRLIGIVACMGLVAWLAIWSAHGWRDSPFADHDRPERLASLFNQPDARAPQTMPDAWNSVLATANNNRAGGFITLAFATARDYRLLPEAYLYAFAYSYATSHSRTAHLMGVTNNIGWLSYFPIAFAIKTPIPTMLVIAFGVIAIRRRGMVGAEGGRDGEKATPRNDVLWIGLITFLITYAAAAILSRVNIGHRHLLPIYPILLVIAGASGAWLATRAGRFAIGAALAWLAVATLWNHPHYLGYFNEIIGGPRNGYHYLADSNIDWGQDLHRLAGFARRHSDQTIHVSYFGSADPTRYGFPCRVLPGAGDKGDASILEPGIYVISVTNLVGYQWYARDEVWRLPRTQQLFADLARSVARGLPDDADQETHAAWEAEREQYWLLRWGRFLCRLRHHQPDTRIGRSLFVYELSAADITALTEP